jgi:hypothetical protein
MGPDSLSEIKGRLLEALAKDPGVLDRIESEDPGKPHPVIDALRGVLAETSCGPSSKKAKKKAPARPTGSTKK